MEPRYNEPLYNEVLDITNDFLSPKIYEEEPRYNERDPFDQNFGPKLSGSVWSDRKSFEKTVPPFEVDRFPGRSGPTKPLKSEQILSVPWPCTVLP